MAALPKFEFFFLSATTTTFFMLCFLSIACAERDFNFNDSQISLLEPKDEPNNKFPLDPYAAEVARCHYAENEIVLSLVLKKHDWSDLTDNKKNKVLEKLSKFFAIPKEFITLESVTKHDLYDMQKQSIRKGNNKCHSNKRLGRVDFMLGCGTKYFTMGEPIANQIGQQMKDGAINNIGGEKFGWWVIWRKNIKSRAERTRRQAEGSGENDYDEEDDYDYDNDDETNEPVTEIPPTTTHAHRHHHGAASKDGVNTSPRIAARMQKFIITSGKEFRFIVPADTFYDEEEDQSNLRLDLTDEVGHVLKPTSWLQFNPETREIYGLPIVATTSKYKYRLTAADAGNLTVTEIVEIEVTPDRYRNVNHEINIAVKINDKNILSVNWQLKLLRAIATILGDKSTTQSIVRELRQTPYDPTAATLVYFNETLPTNECPDVELNTIVQNIDVARLNDLVSPILSIKSIDGKLIGHCQYYIKATTPKAAESSLETSTGSASGTGTTALGEMMPITTSTGSTTGLPDTTAGGSVYTDYVEPIDAKVENTPPEINKRLDKFALPSGKAFRFIIPAETFTDAEDQSNLRLELTDTNGHELAPNAWLHFNAETKEIYGLPVDTDTHKYEYLLTATDSGNLTVAESIQISVQQYSRVRSANHEVYIAVKLNDKNVLNLDWQMKLIRAIATTLGDESTTNLVVREIRPSPYDPSSYTFVYYNETLPIAECPDAELNSLIQRIDVQRLTDLVYPTLSIKSITGQLINACKKDLSATKIKPTTYITKNEPPKAVNQVDRVNATVNQLLVFKVPADTFTDTNDNEPKLTLRTMENRELDARNWLQFDSKNNEFYGIPKSGDVGTQQYQLVAEDSGGLTATDALVVVVSQPTNIPRKEFTAYFKTYLGIRSDQFNANLQRKFFERLAQLFGDETTDLIMLRSIVTPFESDTTIVNFYNTTLTKSINGCHEDEVEAIRNVYFDGQGSLRERVKKMFGAELNLTQIQIMPIGSCYTNVNHHDIIPTKTEEPTLKSTFAEDYMFTFILPAVIIIVLIIIAAIIACCLHHRRMSGKMELGDEEERKSFRPKGIPVIFQDELDEKPESGNKSPIILKNEKPPLLPPSYNTSNMNGDNDVDEYVPPPAVVVGGREIRGKSPATPSYRKPPPYVSP